MASFESRLDEILSHLDDSPPPMYDAMKARLKGVATRLSRSIDPQGTATVTLEPGHTLNVGQQFNVVVHIPQRNNFRDTIFRAYLPPSGTPVTLDFFGGAAQTAVSPEQLEQHVIDFLSLPAIRGMIRGLREMVQGNP
jgi:hypothetical protein